jgi:hypothetical protein
VAVVSKERTDTITTELSDSTIVEVQQSEKCMYQEIILQARNKFHTKPYVGNLRARDRDCQTPGAVRWETLMVRGAMDQERWANDPKLRQIAERWLKTYLSTMYSYFPELEEML